MQRAGWTRAQHALDIIFNSVKALKAAAFIHTLREASAFADNLAKEAISRGDEYLTIWL